MARGTQVFVSRNRGPSREEFAAVKDRALDVRDYGAAGGGLGTTIADGGGDLVGIRAETGQDWMESTDSMDLAAFYRAQAAAEATGRGILFPKDTYVFTAPAFLHAGVRVDLGGSIVRGIATDATRFPRGNRVFVLGILAREDFDRFDAAGWTQQADSAAQDATTLTNVTGTMPAVGDVLMLRTLGSSSTPTLPDYTTWNEVKAVSGTTVTLRYPLERAITSVRFVNYNVITTRKDAMPGLSVGSAEPHVYYCCANASLTNGTLAPADGPAFEFNAALNTDIDLRIDAPKGQAVYGNSLNRCRVRVAGTFGGPKGPVELAVGSALSTVDVDLQYSGDDQASAMGSGSGAYSLVQCGEYTESCIVRGRIDGGTKPTTLGITFPTGSRNRIMCDTIQRGNTTYAVTFPSNAGSGNRVGGHHIIGTATDEYARWSSGGGGDNWLENATFAGDQETAVAFNFLASSLGGIIGGRAPEGKLQFAAGTSGNVVKGAYIREGLTSAGPLSNRVDIQTELGRYPEDDVIAATNLTGTNLASESYGRTWTNTGATAIRTRILPVSVPGMWNRYVCNNASFVFRVDPNGTEVIQGGGAGKYLQLANGAWVLLRCHIAGTWAIEAQSPSGVSYEA